MLTFILLLAGPLLLGGFLLNNVFDDDDDDEARQAEQTREDEVQVSKDDDTFLSNTGEDTLIGSDGDDIYFQTDLVNAEDQPREIDLRGGDDIARIEGDFGNPIGVVLRGGEGDDNLSSEGLEVEIRGGTGDDQIFAGDTSRTFGGDGDDTLTIDVRGSRDEDVGTFISGGDGDDTLTAIKLFRVGPDNTTPVGMSGGEGADTFIVDARSSSLPGVGDEEERPIELSTLATISDFDKDEDKLIVRYEASSAVVDFEVTPFSRPDGLEGSFVRFITGGNSLEDSVIGTVAVFGAPDLTVDDVEFVRTGGLIAGG